MLLFLLLNSDKHIFAQFSDYSQGFGGKYGVQKDRQDKSAAGWDHIEKVDKHESQKGNSVLQFFCNISLHNQSNDTFLIFFSDLFFSN